MRRPGTLRVTGGAFGGRRLGVPGGLGVRPTADRVREALFSILGSRVRGTRVLDLFAGSGALGLEALSRGAEHATFVDSDPRSVLVVRENLEALGVPGEVRRAEALAYLRRAVLAPPFDLVLLDPPYRLAPSLGADLSRLLPPVLAAGALVVSESDRRSPLTLTLPLDDERRYGDTLVRVHGPR